MKTILIVEDNAQVREILVPMLEMWMEDRALRMEVVECCHGGEALAWIKAHGKPGLMLLDVRMPVMLIV